MHSAGVLRSISTHGEAWRQDARAAPRGRDGSVENGWREFSVRDGVECTYEFLCRTTAWWTDLRRKYQAWNSESKGIIGPGLIRYGCNLEIN